MLNGKIVLVTGASRGLGRVIAVALAGAGAELVLAARDAKKLEETREACGSSARVRLSSCDVTSADSRRRLIEEVGRVDVLVNNAGIEHTAAVIDQTDEQVDAQIQTNLVAAIDLTRRVLRPMIERKYGVIVNISSMSGKSPTPYNAIYAATKFGLNGFTSSLDIELEGTGVHAGVVCPSFVAGAGMWADTGLAAPKLLKEVPAVRVGEAVLAVIAGKREVLVTPTPVRPLLALRELFPKLDRKVLGAMGVLDVLKSRARPR
jgi:short-subunit dehydrogenase